MSENDKQPSNRRYPAVDDTELEALMQNFEAYFMLGTVLKQGGDAGLEAQLERPGKGK